MKQNDNTKGVEGEENTPSEEASQNKQPASEEKITQVTEDALSQSEFPEEAEKQKQAFYAMRKKIDELEGKLQHNDEDLDLINMARGTQDVPQGYEPNTTPQNVMFDESDPATKAFMDEAQKAKQEAQAARQTALRAQAQMEDFEAWNKYPELNPKSATKNKAFIDDVQKEFMAERIRAMQQQRQPKRLVEVAEVVQKHYEEIRNQAREQALTESKATMELKEAASLESQGTTVDLSGSDDESKIEELRARIRRGDTQALTELNRMSDPYIQSIPDDAPF